MISYNLALKYLNYAHTMIKLMVSVDNHKALEEAFKYTERAIEQLEIYKRGLKSRGEDKWLDI